MIRFIMRSAFKDGHSGCEGSSLVTLDVEVGELESLLRSGGMGLSGYQRIELVGVEILDSSKNDVASPESDEPRNEAPGDAPHVFERVGYLVGAATFCNTWEDACFATTGNLKVREVFVSKRGVSASE